MLTARWRDCVDRACELPPAALLDLLTAVDALRRPERLDLVLDACAADACSRPGAAQVFAPAAVLHGALAVARNVDAGAAARRAVVQGGTGRAENAIARAVRVARLRALRTWRRAVRGS
jgi:tRNA nucleotidyltransferase (CCA-adding enzyme)